MLNDQPPFTPVTFSYLTNKLFEWDFMQNHFTIRLLIKNMTNWKSTYRSQDFSNEWLGACFNRCTGETTTPFKISYVFNSSIKTLDELLNISLYVSHHKIESLQNLMSFWWQRKKINLCNPTLLQIFSTLSDFLGHSKDVKVYKIAENIFEQLPEDKKILLLIRVIKEKCDKVIRNMPFLLKQCLNDPRVDHEFFPLEFALNNLSFDVALTLLDLCYKKEINIPKKDFELSKRHLLSQKIWTIFSTNDTTINSVKQINSHPIWKEKVPLLAIKDSCINFTQTCLKPITKLTNQFIEYFSLDFNIDF